MRRSALVSLVLGAMLAMPAAVAAADTDGCPAAAGGWERVRTSVAAAEFFDHLLPGQFATAADFAAAIAASSDRDGDGWICRKLMWGDALNPRSHWYKLGWELLGEPTHVILTMDDRANAQ